MVSFGMRPALFAFAVFLSAAQLHPAHAQSVAPSPAVDAAAPAGQPPWLERSLRARLSEECDALLKELEWSDDDRAWFTARVVPAYCNPYTAVPIGDEARKRTAAYREKAEQKNGNPEIREDLRTAYQAIDDILRNADMQKVEQRMFYGRPPAPTSRFLKPGLIRLKMCLHQDWGERGTDAPAPAIASELAAAAATPGLQGDNMRLIAAIIDRLDLGNCQPAILHDASELYAQRPDADKWLAAYFLGAANIVWGWDIRGGGFAPQVDKRDFDEFQMRLVMASDQLQFAHKLKPQWPEAATLMVSVSMASNGVTHGSPLDWYNAAAKADPDPISAAKRLTWAAAPRWNSKPEWSRRVMRDALAGNYSGAFPQVALTAFLDGADDQKDNLETLLAAPGVYELLTQTMRNYLKAPKPGMSPDLAREWLLLLAYHADKPADAAAVLASPGFNPRPTFTVADAPTSSIRSWASVARSAPLKEIAAAEASIREGRPQSALTALAAAAAKVEPGDTATLVASRAVLCTKLLQAAKHEAADLSRVEQVLPELPAQSALHDWLLRGGENVKIERNEDREAIVFGPPAQPRKVASYFLPTLLKQFPVGYEISFDLTFKPGDPDVDSLLRIYFNNLSPDDTDAEGGEVPGPSVLISVRDASFSSAHSERPPRNWTAADLSKQVLKRSIRLVSSGWVAELYSDGELVDWSAGPALNDGDSRPGDWLRFSGKTAAGGDVRIENLSIKAIAEPLHPRPKRERYVPKSRPAQR